MAYVQSDQRTTHGLAAQFMGLIGRIGENISRRRMYRRTYSELNRLTERELADLGLHKSALSSVAWQAVYEK